VSGYVGNVHLSKVEEQFGTGDGSRAIRDLVAGGLAKRREEEQAERAKTRPDGKVNPHVSDAGKCPRKIFFSLIGEPETNPPDNDSLINFAVGNAVEEAFAYLIEPLGGEVIREVRVEIPVRDTVVTGRADFLVALEKFDSILELKSINSRSLKWMLKKQEAGKEDHRRQLNLYLHASKNGLLRVPTWMTVGEGDRKIKAEVGTRPLFFDKGFLVYIVKDATKGEPPVHAFEVQYSERRAKADLADMWRVYELALVDADPGIPDGYKRNAYPCNYCPFQDRCWS
jgi:hypothetical protein